MKRWLRNLPNSTLFWLALGIIAFVGSVLLADAKWDWLRSGTSDDGMESNGATVRNVGFLIAGVLAVVFAVWRGVLANRQAETAQRQSETAQRQAETAQQGLLNERYQKGEEMLGSEVLSVRLGGIYELQSLAEEHPEQYHVRIMRLFCAFVRFPTKDQSLESGQAAIEPGTLLGIRQDVDAIMQAIGSRSKLRIALEREVGFRLDLRGVDLDSTQLLDLDFSNSIFHHAHLSRVNFANTDLTDSFLYYADLSYSEFRNVNFTRTRFWYVHLSRTIFQDVNTANASFEQTNLHEASFLRADLSGAYFTRADLSGADFHDADLNRVNFAGANLSGAEFSFGGRLGAKGLTQAQLDRAEADPDNPPKLEGVLDAETGEPLVWRGRPLDDDA